jgi:uncharacterized membrane protein YqjE
VTNDHPLPDEARDASADAVIAETDAGGPVDAVKATIADVREAASREIALFRAVGQVVGAETKRASLWGGIALVFAIVGLLTLAVALTLMLAAVTGWLAAAFIVPAILLAIAAVGGWKARGAALRLSQAMKAMKP